MKRNPSITNHAWLRPLWLLLVCTFLGLGVTSCDDDDDNPSGNDTRNIVQVAQNNADFSILVAALTKADLTTTLSGAGPYTVFAPNNAAFGKLAGGPLDAFSSVAKINAVTDAGQIAALRNVLLYHVVGADLEADDIPSGASSRTTLKPAGVTGVNDNTIYLSKSGAMVSVNGSTRVVMADIDASNGTIHAIDNVLLPPSQTIAAYVQANTAQFSLLLEALSRPAAASLLTTAASNNSNITVFAPTNAAFQAALTALGLQSLSQVPDAVLIPILQKHIIGSGRVFSSDLAPGTVATLNGNITIAASGSSFTVRGGSGTAAAIAAANVLTTNGVIHAIDQVLLP